APDTEAETQVEALQLALNKTRNINSCLQSVYDDENNIDSSSRTMIKRLATERYITINRLAYFLTIAKKMQVTPFEEWIFDVLKVHYEGNPKFGDSGGQHFQDLFPSNTRDTFLGLRVTLELD
ncbi:unnamed protein product, partial [Owenia fusiformis]